MTDEQELAMFQLAQEITDKYFGAGSYVVLNGFDPSKGETHRPVKPAEAPQGEA